MKTINAMQVVKGMTITAQTWMGPVTAEVLEVQDKPAAMKGYAKKLKNLNGVMLQTTKGPISLNETDDVRVA